MKFLHNPSLSFLIVDHNSLDFRKLLNFEVFKYICIFIKEDFVKWTIPLRYFPTHLLHLTTFLAMLYTLGQC
jgi:hypothetical protein